MILPTVHLRREVEQDQVPITFIKLSNDAIYLTYHNLVGSLKLYIDYEGDQNLKVH